MLMSITERFKEFGVSLAIGMQQMRLVTLVTFETLFITILGLVFGNLIGYGINYYIYLNPIEFGSEFADIYAEYGFLPRIESSLNPEIFININITIVIVALLAVLIPLYKVYKLEPLKGIRYT